MVNEAGVRMNTTTRALSLVCVNVHAVQSFVISKLQGMEMVRASGLLKHLKMLAEDWSDPMPAHPHLPAAA